MGGKYVDCSGEKKGEWLRKSEPLGKSVVQLSVKVKYSSASARSRVTLRGDIPAFSPLMNSFSTDGRMDPAGFDLEAPTRRLSRVPKS